tara:strand:- start:3357 stop:4598 length:1242 start_codon:yes stop_codon:yes gene_type:complete
MVPLLQQYLGLPYEVAIGYVIVCAFGFMLPALLDVPMVPGWITPAIPVVLMFIGDFEPGAEAIQALFAVQFVVFAIFFLLGVTGLGSRLIQMIPNSVQAGVIMGAGIAALIGELEEGGRLASTPISITIGAAISIFLLFSVACQKWISEYRWVKQIANYGILPGMTVGIFVAWGIGEYPLPDIEWGFTSPDFAGMWNYLPFTVGFPSLEVFALAIPTAVVAYIIAFGDILVGRSLMERADKMRPDEKIDYSVSRVHLVTALRNLLHAFLAPYPGLAGPIFTAGTATIAERYKYGPKAMDSIFSGAGTIMIAAFIGIFFLPLVTLFQPVLPIALSLTLVLTGYICLMVGMDRIQSPAERGVAGTMAVIMAIYGAGWGLAAGLFLYLVVEKSNFFGRERTVDQAPRQVAQTEGAD